MKIGTPLLRRLNLFLVLFSLLPIGAALAEDSPLPQQDSLYQEAERLYLKGDSKGAAQALNKIFALPADPASVRSRIRAHNLSGLMFFQTKNLQGAVQEFESAVQIANRGLEGTDSLLHLTRYNLGNALFQSNKGQDAFDALRSVNFEALDQDTRTRFHHLYGNVLASREQFTEALVQYLSAANQAKDIAARDTFLQKAMNVSKNIYLKDPKGDLAKISALSLPSDSAAGVAAKILLARGYMYSGDPREAESILKSALEKAEPSHPLRPRAEEMLADLSKLTEVNSKVVGVLLPLSGKFGKFGRLCLNAITLAYGIYEEMPESKSGAGIRLAIRDSGESPEIAQERFEELVKDEKAIAVIGPLLSKQFPVVARKAQEFGVPLFSLSQKVEANQIGSYVFPIALSPEQQISLIVTHAIQNLGYKKFGILAPDDSFGNEYVTLFWNKVEEMGGEIVGIEQYEPKSTDFRQEIKRLLGLDYLKSRSIELEDLKRRGEQYGSTLKIKGKLRQRYLEAYEPKAIVDFDAIFIPDDPTTIGQIAPSFAVEDVSNIPMLGINTWNTSEIVQRAGRYLQKSLFVDGFLSSSKNQQNIQFVQAYMKNFNAIPGTIEVQAFDAGKIVAEVLADGSVSSRSKLREALLSKGKFNGVSGEFQISENGLKRTAHLLTIKGNSIVEIRSK